jgi:hypothetical protein
MSVAAEEQARNLTEILAEKMAEKAASQTFLSKLSSVRLDSWPTSHPLPRFLAPHPAPTPRGSLTPRHSSFVPHRRLQAHDEVMETFAAFRAQLFAELPVATAEFKEYVASINWTEPFVLALVVFHVSILALLVASRSRVVVQNAVFLLSVVIVLNAERLNGLLSSHWHLFARENYFDQGGAFISLVVSLPLLVNMLVVLVNYSVMFMQTLVVMQRERLGLSSSAMGSKAGAARKSEKTAATPTRRSTRNKKKN